MQTEWKERYTFEELKGIIERLRAEDGCPWDREQTHESLKQCMTEESAELLAAIRIYQKTGNPENMKEELGDVLLQVLLHSQIASEEKLFAVEDVIAEISRKMIRRHPHVFGSVTADDTGTVLRNWEEIKKKEMEGKEWAPSQLRQIPEELPALIRAEKVWKKADKLYESRPGLNELSQRLAFHTDKLAGLAERVDPPAFAEKSPCPPEAGKKEMEREFGEILSVLTRMTEILDIQSEQILAEKVEEIIEKYEEEE